MTTQVADGVYVSSTDAEDYAAEFEFPHDETILVLDGEIEGGPTLHLSPGSIASFAKGVRSTWQPGPGFREFWVYSV